MSSATRGLGLLVLALVTVAAIAASSTVAPERSGAQAGTMHNCPPAGKWSIAVWEGPDGTVAADALAACGDDAVAAGYSLDAQTGAWSRWFAGKPDVSNLAPLSDMQGVLALGGTATAAAAAGEDHLAAAQGSGQLDNCPPAGKWSIAVWDGASGSEAAEALAACGAEAVAAAYSLDAQTGAWSRWFAGKPDVSNLAPLSDMQGVLALGAAAAATPTPVATPTPTSTPASGTPEPGTYTGMTSQARAIQLDVTEGSGSISRIEFDYEGTCQVKDCLCEGHVKTSFPISIPISDNAFSYSVIYYDMSGTFQSTTAAGGDLHAHITGAGGIVCDSGPVTWTASVH